MFVNIFNHFLGGKISDLELWGQSLAHFQHCVGQPQCLSVGVERRCPLIPRMLVECLPCARHLLCIGNVEQIDTVSVPSLRVRHPGNCQRPWTSEVTEAGLGDLSLGGRRLVFS